MSITARTGASGLPRLLLSHPSGATAEVYLHGAHVTSWVPAGAGEAIFLSRAARFQPGRAIRGGIPVIFPQFAELGPLPKHGFARTVSWGEGDGAPGGSSLALGLAESAATLALWPHPFLARMTLELGARSLTQRLTVRNTGPLPFSFTAALHTYLRVGDVGETAVEGLTGTSYRDRTRGNRDFVDRDREVRVRGEMDRAYLGAPDEVTVHDRAGRRRFHLAKGGFADLVVWNPGREVAATFDDMEPDEYLQMLCVEVAQVATPLRVEPGGEWEGVQRLDLVDAADGA